MVGGVSAAARLGLRLRGLAAFRRRLHARGVEVELGVLVPAFALALDDAQEADEALASSARRRSGSGSSWAGS